MLTYRHAWMCLCDSWNLGELILGFHVSFTLSDDDCRNWSIFLKWKRNIATNRLCWCIQNTNKTICFPSILSWFMVNGCSIIMKFLMLSFPAEDFKNYCSYINYEFFFFVFLFFLRPLSFMEKRCRAERKLDGYFLKILCYSLQLRSLKTVVTQWWVFFFHCFLLRTLVLSIS